jgi:uncharacterized protein YjbI with pentapeptide repeats
VTLPIIGVEVPLTGFYLFVPWLFVLLHFNLLIHLGLTSRKLKGFLDDVKSLDEDLAQRLRRDVANFPLAQWMVGHNDAVFRIVLSILSWVLLMLIPPLLLLWVQLRFLPYQDEFFTWLQAAAVAVDALLIVGFRAWFVRQIQPESRWVEGAKELLKRRGLSFALWLRLLLTQPLFRYLIPLIPLGLAGFLAVALSDLLTPEAVKGCGDKPESEEGIIRHIEWWHCAQNRLHLPEKLLTAGKPSPEHVNALRGTLVTLDTPALSDEASNNDKLQEGELEERRKTALDAILGLDLRRRHLREANFTLSLLPKADFRKAQLQGADLSDAQLQGANLYEAELQGASLRQAQLQGANLSWAQLQGAYLYGAQLQGANLFWAQLQDAYLGGAQLQGASLRQAQLQNAGLAGAQLQDADLREARLQGADLRGAELQGAKLGWAQLQGAKLGAQLQDANLFEAQLQDAVLLKAQLQGADLRGAELQGADLWGANLAWVDLTDADLSFADLSVADRAIDGLPDTLPLASAELAGADYVFADGLKGTILDINQPPPDVLPAP